MTAPTFLDMARTRQSWHRLAEHVLAAGQFDAAGTVRLRPLPGGFGTVVGVDGRDAPLPVDRDAARALAGWYALGDAALRRLAAEAGAPQEPVLWPEHLDVAVTVGAATYGCSPGDDEIDEPYLYGGPDAGPPAGDAFWNQPFGAAVPAGHIPTADDAVAFLRQGRTRQDRTATEHGGAPG